ncbi:MAG: nicotinate phosphoribosyltransferase [Acidobacteria bacterium]|nr:MAG: nicotinate phosphoribosyltransferase [Acidobacteriota bacterium]
MACYITNMPASALATDLYQLTMMAGYFAAGRHHTTRATFELFVRRLPPGRSFLVAAGIEQALSLLELLHFEEPEVAWLARQPALARAPAGFFDYLRGFWFSGEVWAVREGTPVFANEPILRVTAPIAEAQLVETALLATINFQTSVASKAARVVIAADGRPVMEFGARRAHGLDAARCAARAAFLAGCAGTSLVEAAQRSSIPLAGTMAHSWVMSAVDEVTAFREYDAIFAEHAVLLLDTYDTIAAARAIVDHHMQPSAVRLDSGDLGGLSREVRAIFDEAGLTGTRIFASGDLDEHAIARLIASGAPIDGFGVGTSVVTSIDAPALGGVYKLVEVVDDGPGRLVMKTSAGKGTWPGRKQIWRVMENARAARDIIALHDEPQTAGSRPLLERVMVDGTRTSALLPLAHARVWCAERIAELPPDLRRIDRDASYDVQPSRGLTEAIRMAQGS